MIDRNKLSAAIGALQQVMGQWTNIPLAAGMKGFAALSKLDDRINKWHSELEAAVKVIDDLQGDTQ